MHRSAMAAVFAAATYRVYPPGGAVDIQIGAPAPALTDPLRRAGARGLAIITAWNPGGRHAAPTINRIAQLRLIGELAARGLRPWPAVNEPDDPAWREQALAVPANDPGPVLALARRHGQAAIVWQSRGGVARLRWP